MEKKHIISIGGELASGKGTVSAILLKELNFSCIYKNGDYFRKLAKEMNMDVTSFNIYVEKHPEIDRQIEYSATEYAKTHDNFIIDARLGWYAVPESFKVYLNVPSGRFNSKSLDKNVSIKDVNNIFLILIPSFSTKSITKKDLFFKKTKGNK